MSGVATLSCLIGMASPLASILFRFLLDLLLLGLDLPVRNPMIFSRQWPRLQSPITPLWILAMKTALPLARLQWRTFYS